jgi:hypothetical protein
MKEITKITEQDNMSNENNIYKRLIKFQSSLSRINKDNDVDFTANGRRVKYSFSSLDDIQLHIQPLLKEAELGYIQPITEKGIKTIIFDIDGNTIESQDIPVNFNQKMQEIGSAITYARRYSLTSMLGIIVGDEDDDGLLGNNNHSQKSFNQNKVNIPKEDKNDSKDEFLLNNIQTKQIQTALDGGRTIVDIVEGIKKKFILSKDIEDKIFNKYSLIEIEEVAEGIDL